MPDTAAGSHTLHRNMAMERTVRQRLTFPPIDLRPPAIFAPTPTHHILQSRRFEDPNGRTSTRRSSIDTPLSLYAATRTKIKMELDAYLAMSSSSFVKKSKTAPQVPLSALCPPQAVPGAVGGSFNSTTKIKCLPLPTLFNKHQLSNRGIRNVGLHSERYLPPINYQQRRITISDSMLNVCRMHTAQRENLMRSENNVVTSRLLQKQRETKPHRVEQAYYMSGHPAQLFDRDEIPHSELEVLQKIAMSQNKHLLYGKGIKSYANKTNKTVERFESKLKDSICAWQSSQPDSEMEIDLDRYSRTMTPGSPIIEMSGEVASTQELGLGSGVEVSREVPEQLPPITNVPTNRTFVTDSEHS